jgi:hypothetical protein
MKLLDMTTNAIQKSIDNRIDSIKESIREFFMSGSFDGWCLVGIMVCVVFNIVDFPGVRRLGGMMFFIWLFVKFMVGG